MRFLRTIAAAAALAGQALSLPFGESDEPQYFNKTLIDTYLLSKRQSGNVITQGVTGSTQNRLEIRQMQMNFPDQWDLFILSMEYFQGITQNDQTGYFGLSSIHGVPNSNWNNVGQCSNCGGADGYCTHNTIIFPCWHRAYMALFEQQFVLTAKALASNWPGSRGNAIRAAANVIRFPFYDWAVQPPNNGPAMPNSISASTITVNAQNGQRTLNNPLASYRFTDTSQLKYFPFTTWQQTYRYPNSNGNNAQSNSGQLSAAFSQQRIPLRDQVFTLLNGCGNYFQFSNDVSNGQGACANSLEQIHNNVHNMIGGPGANGVSGGHMTFLSEAAFDPLFWLHHCNVDRLFSLWQAMHGDYSASQQTVGPTWVIPQGTNVDMNYPLAPFRQNNNAWWTCNTVREWRTFGYDYPDFAQGRGSGNIASVVSAMYGPSATATAPPAQTTTAAPQSRRRNAHNRRQDTGALGRFSTGSTTNGNAITNPISALTNLTSGSGATPEQARNGSLYQYFANIQAPRYTLNGSYNIYAFHGTPASDDQTTWSSDPNLIGSMGIFSQPGRTSNPLLIHGQIPLTNWATDVRKSGQLKDLSETSMIPYMKSNLKIFVVGPDGTEIDPKTISNLVVEIFSSTLDTATSGEAAYSDFKKLPSVDPVANSTTAANAPALS